MDSDVKMARSSGINSRYHGLKTVASRGVSKLMAAKPITGVIVRPVAIRLPKIDERPLHRLALSRSNMAFQDNFGALNPRFKQ